MRSSREKHLPLGIAAVALALVAGFFSSGRNELSAVRANPQADRAGAPVVAVPAPPWLEPDFGEPPEMLASRPALTTTVERCAAAMDLASGNLDGAAERELNASALALSSADTRVLAGWVRDPARAPGFRRASLSLLSRSGSGALPLLAGFLREPVPFTAAPELHPHGDPARGFELSLRVTALEALDRSTETAAVEKLLQGILLQQNDPSLQFMARVALSGIAAGKPHRLGRMIDRMLQERVGGERLTQ